ncbi:MAG: hypothetical protein O2866_06395 [archaeon]|nr:hypothetical protein [archaeon]MDA0842844.1 hypothetical protein [archaeon]MDA1168493.1 hypothetical protein [archaeon]
MAEDWRLANATTPAEPPTIEFEVIQSCLDALSGVVDAIFLPWVEDRIHLEWLEASDDRLGMTRFDEGPNELIRRRRLRLDPGDITIGLHPILALDRALFRHTFVHEFLHAAGLTLHSEEHDSLTNRLAPAPSLDESEVLRNMRQEVLGQLPIQEWTCRSCGHHWKRTTVRTPQRCIKCARPL